MACGRSPIVSVVVIAATVLIVGSHPAARADRANPELASLAGSRPNIVLILTDDQRYDELIHMPALQRELVAKGRLLRRYFVVNSLCCPSRATTLTGQYSHSTGIYLNGDGGGAGGFPDFRDRSTIAVWLQKAGYRTGLVGKYLNHYETGRYVPPGWRIWRALVSANSVYYNYDVSRNGTVTHYGFARQDYATDVFGKMAASFVRSTPSGKPLFLYLAPPAPHGPTTPPPRYANALSDIKMPRYPDFNERDVRDKPAWLRRLPTLPSSEIAALQDLRVRSAETLLAVDDALTRIIRALADTGRLHDTLFVFTSDNGLSSGEHRLTYKLNPYEESIRVPMVVRWDGHVPAGTASMKLAANVDLAPTFATVAGAAHPGVEGVSLIPLIVADRAVRGSFLIEHQHAYGEQDPPTYCAIRTPGWKLVRLATGERELYRLGTDPYELHDAAARYPAQRQRLMARLRELCFPRPPGMPAF